MRRNFGFTLIELLVVIAIIGLLSTLAVVSLNNARAKARDAKRLHDVNQIQQMLLLYYDDNLAFPGNTDSDASGWDCGGSDYDTTFIQPLVTGGYTSQVPIEENSGMGCSYRYYNYGSRVILGVQLENDQPVEDKCDAYQSWVSSDKWYCIDLMTMR